MIAKTAIIHKHVKLGDNVVIEDYCVIGNGDDNKKTLIGDNAVIRAGTIIYSGNIIGNDFQTGNKANIREDNEIGNNVSIGTLSVIEHNVKIMNNVRIHSQAFIPEYTILSDDVWIGPNVVLTNAKYPKHPEVKNNLQGATILRNAKIGANSTILPGIEIGENSLIGAGSVVTKNVPGNSIVAGNPAKIINKTNY